MSVESIVKWILEATTTILPEEEIIRRVESLQQILPVAFPSELKSILETLQSIWIKFLPMGGYYMLKICIMKTLLRFKEEMVDYKEFVHLIYDNITHDDALKINHGEEFARDLMSQVADLCSTVFGPRCWFRIFDEIEVFRKHGGIETCVPAIYLGRHHTDGQCVIQYTIDGRLITEVVPNSNILGKRKKIPLGPIVEGMPVEYFDRNFWIPTVTKAQVADKHWVIKVGEKLFEACTRYMRSYQPIDERRLCDANKQNFTFLCRDGKCYSYPHVLGFDCESDEESETDYEDEPETEKTTRVKSKTPVAPETASARTLSVCNLPDSVQRADVENFFKDAGKVVDLHFSTNEEGMFRVSGAHVEFDTVEAAMKALDLNGRDLSGHAVRIAYMDFMDDDSQFQQSFRT
ncbi:uncharacterized protein LOC107412504 isoform X1 [Ziziphus jujuba]|uniref:Uncharacterized protein LOC107412504 isoform X1 n=2 Tax=Ziziphus jujuba TaxID=326968 RepID=A0A6P3ZBE1_ZIZJJ|nr:uncharacterized protein LOC107412504 isoform X1 [Ziziphus jujuba]